LQERDGPGSGRAAGPYADRKEQGVSPKPNTVDPERVREVTCDACGERVRIDFTKREVTSMRELASTPAPGRVTIRVGDVIVHQCADGTFGLPENVIER
jgi:hypothetical protein